MPPLTELPSKKKTSNNPIILCTHTHKTSRANMMILDIRSGWLFQTPPGTSAVCIRQINISFKFEAIWSSQITRIFYVERNNWQPIYWPAGARFCFSPHIINQWPPYMYTVNLASKYNPAKILTAIKDDFQAAFDTSIMHS